MRNGERCAPGRPGIHATKSLRGRLRRTLSEQLPPDVFVLSSSPAVWVPDSPLDAVSELFSLRLTSPFGRFFAHLTQSTRRWRSSPDSWAEAQPGGFSAPTSVFPLPLPFLPEEGCGVIPDSSRRRRRRAKREEFINFVVAVLNFLYLGLPKGRAHLAFSRELSASQEDAVARITKEAEKVRAG